MFLGGCMLVLTGLVLGRAWGEASMDNICWAADRISAPPRFWYFALFGGVMLVLVAVLGAVGLASSAACRWLEPLALLGRNALGVFCCHGLILPAMHFSHRVVPSAGRVVDLAVLGAFSLYVFEVCWSTARADRRRAGGGESRGSQTAKGAAVLAFDSPDSPLGVVARATVIDVV
jgi:hypothetical protein